MFRVPVPMKGELPPMGTRNPPPATGSKVCTKLPAPLQSKPSYSEKSWPTDWEASKLQPGGEMKPPIQWQFPVELSRSCIDTLALQGTLTGYASRFSKHVSTVPPRTPLQTTRSSVPRAGSKSGIETFHVGGTVAPPKLCGASVCE